MITTPMMNKQIRQAITIRAKDFVGFMNSSSVQLLMFASCAKMISYELGIIGVHTRSASVPSIANTAVNVST